MIAVRLWGRLGNQLFQYSFGQSLSERTGEDVYFYVLENNSGNELAPICNFVKGIRFLEPAELKRQYRLYGNDLAVRIERKLISLFPFINRKILIERSTGYSEINAASYACFDGYWQSYRYFSEISARLKKELNLNSKFELPGQLAEEISGSNSVAVHFRRGDYLSGRNRSVYGYCSPDYYKRGISYIIDRVKDPVFYIFSDDIDWVRSNFSFWPERTKFVSHNIIPSDCIDITLMRKCKHYLIANSTFSWWGAFLGDNPDKIVVAPENWYIGKKDLLIHDLIPSGWILK